MMPQQRMLWNVILAGGLVVGLVVGECAPVWAGPPTETLKKTIDEVIRILDDPAWKKPEKKQERRKLLEELAGQRFNYTEMAKRALGTEWAKLSPEEQQEFAVNFQTMLVNTYIGRVENYAGEKVQYLKETVDGKYAEVRTKIVRGESVIAIEYRLQKSSEDWRVYDVVVGGTSLIQNYREQFRRIIRKESFAALSEMLRKKSNEIRAPSLPQE